MKKNYSLRVKLIVSLLIFVLTIMGIIYFVQTTFLDDFYQTNKIKAMRSVGAQIAESIGDEDIEEMIVHLGMNNEVCIRTVSNNTALNYTGACTLRNLDLNTINSIAQETIEEADSEKLFDRFKYQRRFDDRPEDFYIFSKMIEYNSEKVLILVSSGITPLDATISTIKSQYLLFKGLG